MTQSTFPLAGSADAGEQELDDVRPQRRRLMVLAGVAVVALGGAGMLLLTGDPQEVVLDPPPVAPVRAAAAPTATAAATADRPVDPARARDPFQALYVPPPAGGVRPAAGALPAGTPGDPAPPAQPVAPGVVAPGAAAPGVEPPAAAPVAGAPVAGATSVLALTRVEGTPDARRAVFSLDGKPVTAGVGDSFGGALLLLSVQEGPADGQWTAVVQSGQGEPFDVVSGEPAVSL